MTEIEGNPGSSITNSAERVYEALLAGGYIPGDARIVEHYESRSYRDEEYSVVTFPRGRANWTSISKDDLSRLIDFPELFEEKNLTDTPRLLDEVGRLRAEIDPHWGLQDAESPEKIARRQAILENAVSKAEIIAAINAGSGERAFQKLLSADLSLLGEVYADPPEEYIAFREFPVDDGVVDFAVFTGRSRMEIFLIEVKGADFRLVNRSGYGNISSKANEAAQQVRERIGVASRNYDSFRRFVHKVRGDVETGRSRYGALLGPYTPLEVDPAKDIWIRGVVVAGFTVNDQQESRLRHNFERSSHAISLDSWNTWARRLTRP